MREDLEALARESEIYLLWSRADNPGYHVALPRDLVSRQHPAELPLDADMAQLMAECLPVGADFRLDLELQREGIRPAKRAGARPVQVVKDPKRRRRSQKKSKFDFGEPEAAPGELEVAP